MRAQEGNQRGSRAGIAAWRCTSGEEGADQWAHAVSEMRRPWASACGAGETTNERGPGGSGQQAERGERAWARGCGSRAGERCGRAQAGAWVGAGRARGGASWAAVLGQCRRERAEREREGVGAGWAAGVRRWAGAGERKRRNGPAGFGLLGWVGFPYSFPISFLFSISNTTQIYLNSNSYLNSKP